MAESLVPIHREFEIYIDRSRLRITVAGEYYTPCSYCRRKACRDEQSSSGLEKNINGKIYTNQSTEDFKIVALYFGVYLITVEYV